LSTRSQCQKKGKNVQKTERRNPQITLRNVDELTSPTNSLSFTLQYAIFKIKPKLSGFLLNLRRSLAHKGFAKILGISTGMPAVFANPYASRFHHISSQKIKAPFYGYNI